MVMDCPHCEADIDSVTRTGENRYSCGDCNMVISYDDLEPHLDELNVNDKRGDSGDTDEMSAEDVTSELPPPPGAGEDSAPPQQSSQQQSQGQQQINQNQGSMSTSPQNEREVIYQRGTQGLKQIKKERLDNWLAQTDNVGAQTQNRITMVFERNESVHKNPHVLYNLLDDEISASASYINTMVEDVFAPEEEHADLLQSQGYTPWHNRAGQGPNAQQGRGQGGPMNATGSRMFNPGQGQQQQQQQSQQEQSGDESISRTEAEMMMQQVASQANEEQKNALLSGLSDATDEAMREMATNVGGLAGTIQRVVDEALVSYARDNPEWVIENMGVLQKVIGATEDMPGSEEQEPQQAQQDQKVDDALENLGSGGNSQQGSQSSQQNNQATRTQSSEPEPTESEPNPDLDDSLLESSEFEPSTNNDPMSATPENDTQEETTEPKPKPTPGEEASQVSEQRREEFENQEQDNEQETESEGFDEIFGDMGEAQ